VSNYVLQLSGGTTTIDFYSGETNPPTPGYFVQEGGLDLPPPSINASFNNSDQADSAPMSRAVYGNRTITITFGIIGSSLADLKTKIRTLQGCLNDAAYRYLLGTPNTYYLASQWGTTAGASTYFDVLRGDLQLPSDCYDTNKLSSSFVILGCKLVLTCLPFGRSTAQTIGNVTLMNGNGNLATGESYISSLYDQTGSMLWYQSMPYNLGIAQTFTPQFNQTIAGAGIYCYQSAGANLGNVYFTIYAVDGSHKPTGAALATGNVSSTLIPTNYNQMQNWLFCAFGTPVALTSGTEYALVVSLPSFVSGYFYTGYSVLSNPYPYGQAWTSNDGSSWGQTVGTADFAFVTYYQNTNQNYQEIVTDNTFGDVPAGLQHNLSGLATNVNIWIAKRSGASTLSPASIPRYQEPIWIQCASFASYATDSLSPAIVGKIPVTGGTCNTPAANMGSGAQIAMLGNTPAAAQAIAHYKYSLAGISAGTFRVLFRGRVEDITHMGFAFGWENSVTGSPNMVPATTSYVAPAVSNTWKVMDLGALVIPSVANPGSTQLLRMPEYLNLYAVSMTSGSIALANWDFDWIFLLPTDEGYANFKSGTGYSTVDSISKAQGIYDVDAGLAYVSNFFASVGPVPTIGREPTRIYVIQDTADGVKVTSQVKYQPRFITI